MTRFSWNIRRIGEKTVFSSDGVVRSHRRMNSLGTEVVHEGSSRDCSNTVCRRLAEQEVPWGVWCRHGHQIVQAVPAEHTCGDAMSSDCPACYPAGRVVDPWPCGLCSLSDWAEGQKQMEEDYWESMWNEYYTNR